MYAFVCVCVKFNQLMNQNCQLKNFMCWHFVSQSSDEKTPNWIRCSYEMDLRLFLPLLILAGDVPAIPLRMSSCCIPLFYQSYRISNREPHWRNRFGPLQKCQRQGHCRQLLAVLGFSNWAPGFLDFFFFFFKIHFRYLRRRCAPLLCRTWNNAFPLGSVVNRSVGVPRPDGLVHPPLYDKEREI